MEGVAQQHQGNGVERRDLGGQAQEGLSSVVGWQKLATGGVGGAFLQVQVRDREQPLAWKPERTG